VLHHCQPSQEITPVAENNKKNPWDDALPGLSGIPIESPELTSFNRLIQELISGVVQRNTFTQWELELLLDLQTSRIRKSSRPEILRRYLRAVQQHFASHPDSPPLRLAAFVKKESGRRISRQESELERGKAAFSAGLSSI
jgi:hypothetical protein